MKRNRFRLWDYEKRLDKCFANAKTIPVNENDKIVLISDCHRGCGNQGDNFLKNRNLYLAAVKEYLKEGYIYIELGDGDELWENRQMACIEEVHADVFAILKTFQAEGRLYQLIGNHDCENRTNKAFPHEEALILRDEKYQTSFYLIHGHQADFLNSTLWKLSRFLVRYLWKPLEQFGISDPTSAARNYRIKDLHEKRLSSYAAARNILLITGHTHRPILDSGKTSYFNTGSCVHPSGITCLEIASGEITLVKWQISTDETRHLYVHREPFATCKLETLSHLLRGAFDETKNKL